MPFPRPWQEVLHDRVWQYSELSVDQRDRLHNCVKVIVAEVDWRGLDGIEVIDGMKVTIAGHISLMLLGLEDDFMDEARSIYICRREFDDRKEWEPIYDTDTVSGRAHMNGATTLSWHHVLNARHGGERNLVIHEFAHHFDRRDNRMDGTLRFKDPIDQKQWTIIMEEEYNELCDAAATGRWTILRHYGAKNKTEFFGAKNKTEFFAVATECFFESPDRLKRSHWELYDLLARYYNLDTVRWLA
ncbi:MAG: M90 family metallopeptidase [Pirellula sp.]|nr:M90 family metallopeptidase [Pirellula sp.]